MACLNRLKSDIRVLRETFTRSHPVFQVTNATVDEIACFFVVKNGDKERKYPINANITENYPKDPPVWFSDSDDIAGPVQVLATTVGDDNLVCGVFTLCHPRPWLPLSLIAFFPPSLPFSLL